MNRIVVIGNGFDLALDLKTSYQDLMVWYLNTRVIPELENLLSFNDDLLSITIAPAARIPVECNRATVQKTYEYILSINQNKSRSGKPFILKHIPPGSTATWANFEENYFDLLKKYKSHPTNIKIINGELSSIENLLAEYLMDIQKSSGKNEPVMFTDLLRRYPEEYLDLPVELGPGEWNMDLGKILILNFNYTHTADSIVHFFAGTEYDVHQIHIHGRLGEKENPLIFGYGDETDPEFQAMKDLNHNALLKHFKSYKYSLTNNLRLLRQFQSDDIYDVHIIGHSCALSDRVLLSSIFEDENCFSIVPYLRRGVDNYFDLQTSISRHIENMNDFRYKIMIKPQCPRFSK